MTAPKAQSCEATVQSSDTGDLTVVELAGDIDARATQELERARQHNVEVSASGLNGHYREIFEFTGLSDFMTIDAN
jgi:anti-anti-sigma regulatory factor